MGGGAPARPRPGGAGGGGPAPGGGATAAADAVPAPEPRLDPEALVLAFEEAAARGDAASAAAAALAAARAHREEGRLDAAFDACLLGVGVRPGDVDLHLMLADLAVDRGWTGQAADAYRQLLRLADLAGDAAGADLVRRTAAARLPNDPRFVLG